jgi:hypothetical protein
LTLSTTCGRDTVFSEMWHNTLITSMQDAGLYHGR